MNKNIYENWKPQRWETLMSDFYSPVMEFLLDGTELEIVIRDGAEDDATRVSFVFKGQYAYRNINESYRNDLWSKYSFGDFGWTWELKSSDFLEVLTSDGVGSDTFAKAKHYVLLTEDDVIEIIARDAPIIKNLPHKPNQNFGKSKVDFK